MKTKYRYRDGRVVDDDGMPMLNQAERSAPPVAPMLISDSQPHLMSMTNGKHYDSKSEMRKEYKRAGVVEVGDQAPMKREGPTRADKEKARKERRGAIERTLSKLGYGAP